MRSEKLFPISTLIREMTSAARSFPLNGSQSFSLKGESFSYSKMISFSNSGTESNFAFDIRVNKIGTPNLFMLHPLHYRFRLVLKSFSSLQNAGQLL